jgi:hypothetical protein
MKPCSESLNTKSTPVPDLELPVEPYVRFFPPSLPVDEMIKRNQKIRESFPASIRTEEERLARKVDVPFVL